MTTISAQRDLVIAFKKETFLNIDILRKSQPVSVELSNLLNVENAFEKPTQHFFNYLSYYLVSIIDPTAHSLLPWPLYDTKTERNYRNEFAKFVLNCSNKGLVNPVMSSYFVNPGSYKVTVLIYQLSQLAVKKTLLTYLKKRCNKTVSNKDIEQCDWQSKDFIENIQKNYDGYKVEVIKLYQNHLQKRQKTEEMAKIFRNKITAMENLLKSCQPQKYLDNLVENFIQKYNCDEALRKEILKIRNVHKPAPIFDTILEITDNKLDKLESEWNDKMNPFVTTCQNTWKSTNELIARFNGCLDKKLYMVEYNPKTDDICTKDLQSHVNSEQKFILKNIVKNDTLSFPNLIRGFFISMCFILKNCEEGDDTFKFNQYLESGRRNMKEIALGLNMLNDRMKNLDEKIQLTPTYHNISISNNKYCNVQPVPDFSDIKFYRDQLLFDSFTPLSFNKHNFNLRKRANHSTTIRQPDFITPYHHKGPRDQFFKSLLSCHISSYSTRNMSHNINNLSVISQAHIQPINRINETISECSAGFTKQQIMRLLSTKKTSSTKKNKFMTQRPSTVSNCKKGALFNESTSSNESNGLFRSYSSPNLYENKEKKCYNIESRRKLSIMQEENLRPFDMSGITSIYSNNSQQSLLTLESSGKVVSDVNLRMNSTEKSINQTFKDSDLDTLIIKEQNENPSIIVTNSSELQMESKLETPKSNTCLIKKTSSLEKIINRFKKVRASVIQMDQKDNDSTEIQTILEEKENFNTINVDVVSANRILLPDLLSPSCSTVWQKTEEFGYESDEFEPRKRKPRESLGTVLGVDHTFLDQFELID